jgi:subtilase family serine protease
LDVEWAHAIAPYATILLVEAKSADSNDLISAIQYAASQSGVVAVSMSWGTPEFLGENSYDSLFTSSYGAAFFASSGDNGSGVIWPACSPNVVAVGGTTLNLASNGTVISETAWSESGGGVSVYEPMPVYQTSYGLNYSGRAVPDVSYDADPSTGVSVCYNSNWYVFGGTSVGAPQWAAIYALSLSATNANLYFDAKYAYSSCFRDITSGSNGNYAAGPGYDLVTGLGSPLTDDFSPLAASPASGPAGGTITLRGIGFTADSSVNISYLNPVNSSWVPIASNVPTASSQNFTYTFNAPDLKQNNPAGDNPPSFDNIVFQAVDNSNGNSYNTTISYQEWRRGLTQVDNITATGLYGNDTNLATAVFVQNGQSLTVAGEYFSPGTASLFWDGTTSLGTATIDEAGSFNTTVLVPNTTAGQHTLTINDGSANFCVNLTRLPTVTNDYDGLWHTSDITINLTPDYNVTEIYYRINNGPVENVSANGQPVITTEGSNNTLEYWSTWNVYGTGIMELPHVTLTGIKLDKTPPQGSIQINNGAAYTFSTDVTLTLSATDQVSGISQIRFSNGNTWNQATWQPYISTYSWQLTSGDGVKTVYCQIEDNAGLITTLNCSIILSTIQPTLSQLPTPNPTTSSTSSATSTSSASPSATPSTPPSHEHSATPPATPELSIPIVLASLALLTVLFAAYHKRKPHAKPMQ